MRKAIPYFVLSAFVFAGEAIAGDANCVPDPNVTERFIPVELLTGSEWDGAKEINLPNVDRAYPVDDYSSGGIYNYNVTLKGPIDWRHPDAGRNMKIYERVVGVSGANERFAVRSDKKAAGRVTDSRTPVTWDTEAKFPLGNWEQGEKRNFTHDFHVRGRIVDGETDIEIEKISCNYKGVKNSLQYRWKSYRRGSLSGDYSYIYGPNKGMMAVIVHKSARRR